MFTVVILLHVFGVSWDWMWVFSFKEDVERLYWGLCATQAEHVQNMSEESSSEGTISIGLYMKYLRAGASVMLLVVLLIVNILVQVCSCRLHST